MKTLFYIVLLKLITSSNKSSPGKLSTSLLDFKGKSRMIFLATDFTSNNNLSSYIMINTEELGDLISYLGLRKNIISVNISKVKIHFLEIENESPNILNIGPRKDYIEQKDLSGSPNTYYDKENLNVRIIDLLTQIVFNFDRLYCKFLETNISKLLLNSLNFYEKLCKSVDFLNKKSLHTTVELIGFTQDNSLCKEKYKFKTGFIYYYTIASRNYKTFLNKFIEIDSNHLYQIYTSMLKPNDANQQNKIIPSYEDVSKSLESLFSAKIKTNKKKKKKKNSLCSESKKQIDGINGKRIIPFVKMKKNEFLTHFKAWWKIAESKKSSFSGEFYNDLTIIGKTLNDVLSKFENKNLKTELIEVYISINILKILLDEKDASDYIFKTNVYDITEDELIIINEGNISVEMYSDSNVPNKLARLIQKNANDTIESSFRFTMAINKYMENNEYII